MARKTRFKQLIPGNPGTSEVIRIAILNIFKKATKKLDEAKDPICGMKKEKFMDFAQRNVKRPLTKIHFNMLIQIVRGEVKYL